MRRGRFTRLRFFQGSVLLRHNAYILARVSLFQTIIHPNEQGRLTMLAGLGIFPRL